MIWLLSMAFASQLTVPETSYVGATILEGDIDVTFDHIYNINYEIDTETYAFFEGNTLMLVTPMNTETLLMVSLNSFGFNHLLTEDQISMWRL